MPGLIKGRADRSGHAAFDAEQPLAQAARRWMAQGLAALLANAVGALRSDQPEFVHQARIALRLIRVGMEVLAPALDLAPVHGRALQTWTKEFGAVRDWDVLCGQLLPSLRRDAGEDGAARWERLQQAAVRRQQRARERLRRRLDAPGFGEFALHLLRWSVSEPQEQGARLGAFAQKAVRQRRHRLAKAARGFAGASMARQHKIRLQAKSLRYAIETLHGVLPGALRGAELRTLSRFQDSAGCARDLALAESTLEGLTSSRQLRRQIADWTREQRRIGLEKAQRLAAELANW